MIMLQILNVISQPVCATTCDALLQVRSCAANNGISDVFLENGNVPGCSRVHNLRQEVSLFKEKKAI